MFGVLESLAKAAVATVATPVALVVDVVTLPDSAMDLNKGPFDRTGKMLDAIGENLSNAVEPKKE